MKTVKPLVLKDMMGQLDKYVVLHSHEIPQWTTYDGQYLGGGKYEFYKETETTINVGDRWFARYDGARIFRAKTVLPEEFVNKKIYLHIDFGGESLVRVNGKIIGSISSRENSGWICRDVVPLPLSTVTKADQEFEIELESGVDSGGFCDEAMAGAKEKEYQITKAAFIAVDPVCEKFVHDTEVIWEALKSINDEFIKNKVYAALDDALHMVDYDFDDEAVRKSIKEASSFLDAALDKIPHLPPSDVIMDGHSHIDVAWLWRIQESERKAARTFSNNLALMDIYSEFTFTQSQAILYDMIKRLYPEIYDRIREKVKNGQWEVVGNVWVECDTNIASGEAMIRQLLYGREFFMNEFGISSDTYWLPDCFGFSHALPQIIKRSGMKYFITSKLRSQDTNRFPHTLFRWKGADGSEVIAYNQRSHYQGDYTPDQICETTFCNDQKEFADGVSFGMFGYGDGGGGCTYKMIENAMRLKNFPGLPSSHMGHPSEFFAKVSTDTKDLPVYNDELYYENHRGTYTSQAFIKKGNRKGEFLLSRAEMAAVFANEGYDKEQLEELWKTLLKNQFHDILPGTSIHEAIEDCRPDYDKIMKDGSALFDNAVKSVNAKISADKDGVVVWNFNGFLATAPVTAEVPAGTVGIEGCPSNVFEKDGKTFVSFIANAVPSMGYKFFPFGKGADSSLTASTALLENELLRVEIDANGELSSVYDKKNCREVLTGKGNTLTVFIDKCVHETAWNLEQNYEKKSWPLTNAVSVELVEQNSFRGVVRVKRKFNKSEITQDIILYSGSDHIDFDTLVDWHESDKVLKAAFPVSVLNTEASFEIAHGAIKRPTHRNNSYDAAKFEQCAHKWADLSEGDYGVSILNDCKYGHDIRDNVMRITLMRAPTCPDTVGDHGISTFVYSLYPHSGTWQNSDTVKNALTLNVPLNGYAVPANNGSLDSTASFVSTDRSDIVIDAVKKAQDGDGIIVRIYEAQQKRGNVTLTANLPFTRVCECNLMEENETDIAVEGNSFSFNIRPFEVKTFRLS